MNCRGSRWVAMKQASWIGRGKGLQLHEMDRRLQQPLRLLPGLPQVSLPGEVPDGAAVVGVGPQRAGLSQPAPIVGHLVDVGVGPGREGVPQDAEVLLRLVDVDVMDAGERFGEAGGGERVPEARAADVGVGPRIGVRAVRDDRVRQLVAAQGPEPRVARQQAVEVGGAGAVDADDEHRLRDLLPLDLRMALPLAREPGVAAQAAAQVGGHHAEPGLQQARLRRLQSLHQTLETGA